MTYYLKYRPQTLNDLDQEGVRNSLIKIFKTEDTPHAFLFSGPRGTGKTSAARIIAKILNCEDLTKDREPCNKCDQCKMIGRGESLDVIELDAASHRGIDDVRQIREAVKLAPVSAKKKVYIVDEAHMLTTEASNALLKTLEEPPNHVVFILATTNPEKLIETIRSRVTNVLFKKAKDAEIIRSLKRVSAGEKLKIDEKALSEIAKKADGSFRDAVKALEQIVSEISDLSLENISEFLFNTKKFVIADFLKQLADKNAKEAIVLINSAIDGGLSAKELAKNIIAELRKMLLSEVGIGEEQTKKMFDRSELVKLVELFLNTSMKIPQSFIEQVPLEIAVIDWCVGGGVKYGSGEDIELGDGVKEITKLSDGKKESSSPKVAEAAAASKLDKQITKMKNGNDDNTVVDDVNLTSGFDGTLREIDSLFWSKILLQVRDAHTSTEALLRASKPIGFDGNTLKLGVFYKFHKEHLESNQHRLILERTVGSMVGNEGGIRVVCELMDPPKISEIGETIHTDKPAVKEVVLTEPKTEPTDSSQTLTNGGAEDIINLAEKIFSN